MRDGIVDVARWLAEQGLGQHAQSFAENGIAGDILRELTDADLKELGLNLGDRKRLLKAIATLDAGPTQGRAGPAEPTATPPVPRGAERRQLTVMFVDLVGSTALSQRLDPEETSQVLRDYQNMVAGEVTRFEGHVAKFMGDGILAYFGWPRAYEDAAERAVRAGLAATEAVARMRVPTGDALAARVGIATGLVVVGDLIGKGAAQEEAVVGDTPNLAARLQTAADPGQVIVAGATQRLLGDLFDLEDLGQQTLKGIDGTVPAFAVHGERPATSRFEARAIDLSPMVGREHELALLVDRWRLAKAGEGQGLLLVGEAGIGKSRLARALIDAVVEEPHAELRFQCSPLHVDSTLWPILQHLRRAAGFASRDADAAKLSELERLLREVVEDPSEAMAFLAPLLGIESEGDFPPLDFTPHQQRARTLETLTNYLLGLARRRPVLVLLEDLHWIDPTSLELVEELLKRMEQTRLLLMLTSRPTEEPVISAHSHVTRLTLNRLGRGATQCIADRLAGKPLPEEVRAEIAQRTDGVPLFVEELTKAILESNLLCDTGEYYQLTGPLPALAIPSSLQDSLMARLDRLAPVKEVAQVAACLGREFHHQLLAAVVPLPEPELTRALDRLVGAELLFRRGVPPEASYTFKHALVRDAAYASLLKSRRRQYHARIAKVLKEQFPETAQTQPELLAQHFAEAGLVEEAIDHWHDASQHAVARSAMEEASTQAAKGLELLQSLAPGPSRLGRELNLQLALASALNATKGHGTPEVRQTYARAVELAKQLEDTSRLFPALDGLITSHFSRAELAVADKLAEEFLRLAGRSEEAAPQLIALSEVGPIRLALGDLVGARRSLERALELYDPAQHGSLYLTYSFDPQVVCLGYLSWTLFSLGYPTQALRFSRQSIVEARRSSHPMTLAFALGRSAAVLHMCRNWQGLEATVTELMALAVEREFRNYRVVGRFYLGWAQVRSGRSGEGLELLREALTDMRVGGDEDWFPHSLSLLAEAHHKAGQIGEGLGLLEEAVDRVESNGERWFAAEVHRLRGELLLSLFDPSKAEECFLRATKVAHGQKAKLWELRAATSLARLWAEQRERQKAHDLLAPIYGWFTEGFETADLIEAKSLLDTLA
jgi:class 3 adenylate cyclase/predicted ATPase